jgi:hypothetical protein
MGAQRTLSAPCFKMKREEKKYKDTMAIASICTLFLSLALYYSIK